ncbi:hypothetical protein YC2023_006527 [Brassica napus]
MFLGFLFPSTSLGFLFPSTTLGLLFPSTTLGLLFPSTSLGFFLFTSLGFFLFTSLGVFLFTSPDPHSHLSLSHISLHFPLHPFHSGQAFLSLLSHRPFHAALLSGHAFLSPLSHRPFHAALLRFGTGGGAGGTTGGGGGAVVGGGGGAGGGAGGGCGSCNCIGVCQYKPLIPRLNFGFNVAFNIIYRFGWWSVALAFLSDLVTEENVKHFAESMIRICDPSLV